MSTVRHQLSTANSIRRFSVLHNQSQRLITRMHLSTPGLRLKLPEHGETAKQKDKEKRDTDIESGNGIANQLSHKLSSLKSPLPVQQTRTFLAKLSRKFPASTQSTRPHISPVEAPSTQAQTAPLQLTNLPYFVRRTPSNKLPVYLETKAGGTKRLTKIQKTEGDLEALKSDLAKALNLETGSKKPEVTINSTTGHIIVKVCGGQGFLQERAQLTDVVSFLIGLAQR